MRRVIRDAAELDARGVRWQKAHGAPWDDQEPLLHYGVGGPVYGQTKLQRRELTSMLRPYWGDVVLHRAGNSLWLDGGILIDYVSGDRADTIPGVGWDGCWWTEAARLKGEVYDDAIYTRLTGKPDRKSGWGIFDTTPKGRNWFWSTLARRADPADPLYDPEFALHGWTTADNLRSPAAQAEVAKARRRLPWRYFRRDYLASFEAFEGQVWDEFERKVHVVPASRVPSQFARVIIPVDWGYRNPGVLLAIGLTGDGDAYVFREAYESGVQVRGGGATWTSRAKEWADELHPDSFACDPSAPDNIAAFVEAGLPAHAADNAVADGIRRVAERLHYVSRDGGLVVPPRLYVSDECPITIREVEGYHYHPRREGGHSEEPEKVNDHTCDALRMGVSELDKPAVPVGHYEPAMTRPIHGVAPAADDGDRPRRRTSWRSNVIR